MRTSRWMTLVPALAALCVLSGALSAATETTAPADPGKAPAPICQKAIPAAIAVPAPGTAHDTGDFCDATADHGTSVSCKAEAKAKGLLTCTTGKPTNVDCSVGQSCSSGNGSWCSCSYDCTRVIAVDPDADPVEPNR